MRTPINTFELSDQLRKRPEKLKGINTMNTVIDGTQSQRLYTNLMVPSYVHGYSLAIEYMVRWFEKCFDDKKYFKSIYIDGAHVIDDYKKFSKMIVKGENPRLRVEPRLQFDYDMETLDLYQAPPWLFLRRSKMEDSFFKDHDRKLYLAFNARAMQMEFNFKARVNTRSQQLDLLNRIELNFKVGATQSDFLSVDWHIPKEIMLYIANAAGFKIQNGEVVDTIEFIQYLNRHSELSFLFKLRAINKKPEFFIRMSNMETNIRIQDKLQHDDGERDGKLDFNFHVEMNCILRMPVPHFYRLYSADDIVQEIDISNDALTTANIHTIALIDIPKEDEHHWPQAAITDYLCDNGDTEIDLSSLFSGENILHKIIHHDLLLGVNPFHFLNIRIYRDEDLARNVPFTIDWESMKILFDKPRKEEYLHIVIYYDREYVNVLEINENDYQKNRVIGSPDKDKEKFRF